VSFVSLSSSLGWLFFLPWIAFYDDGGCFYCFIIRSIRIVGGIVIVIDGTSRSSSFTVVINVKIRIIIGVIRKMFRHRRTVIVGFLSAGDAGRFVVNTLVVLILMLLLVVALEATSYSCCRCL